MQLTRRVYTLVMIQRNGDLLLGLKKRGFGVGLWNGFGGKVEPGETIDEAAKRELYEESGLVCHSLVKRGISSFELRDRNLVMEVHIYGASEYEGEPVETEEMKPHWFPLSALPQDQMFEDNKIWFPVFLSGKPFSIYFVINSNDCVDDHFIKIFSSREDVAPLYGIPQQSA
ncbi:putative 7,8-dihydro-8-oxoguanine triphosphatase [Halotydeus destructor]|nr:putative 7,8-dihydro-8-oxoguanine triphosphatase [Halotydeus destructor]